MDSSSGLSSNSNYGLEGDLQQLMDLRKRKRMVSNRESARRSRLRKQKYLDGLAAEVARLKVENSQILKKSNDVKELYLKVEAENAILRARAAELSHRLQSLEEIVSFVSTNNSGLTAQYEPAYEMDELDMFINSCSWNGLSQPIATASADAWFEH